MLTAKTLPPPPLLQVDTLPDFNLPKLLKLYHYVPSPVLVLEIPSDLR